MDKKLILKMIQNCFKQYYSDADSLPINSMEMEQLCNKIVKITREEKNVELYEVVNDTVYEYLTN